MFFVFVVVVVVVVVFYAEQPIDIFLLFGCDDPAYDPSHSS